jgi:hypothetical protein
MELTTHRFYQVGPPNLGHGPYHVAYQEAFKQGTYGAQEGRQHLGPVRDIQQTSEPRIKPDSQYPSALPFFHNIPHYEQNPNPNEMPQEMQPNRRSLYDGMHVQNIAESTNGHFHNHQQRHPQEVDQKGPPATPGRVEEQTYAAHNSSSDGSVGGSYDGRPRKAQRTVIVSIHD